MMPSSGEREELARVMADTLAEVGNSPFEIADAILAAGYRRASGWLPISEAPRDGTDVLALMGGGYTSIAKWDDDKYRKIPKPYWRSQRGYLFGVSYDRANQPTHFQSLPLPPEEEKI